MKVQYEKAEFQPITLVIETQTELDWLFACLNTSFYSAEKGWNCLAPLVQVNRQLCDSVQIPMFDAIKQIYEEDI